MIRGFAGFVVLLLSLDFLFTSYENGKVIGLIGLIAVVVMLLLFLLIGRSKNSY